MKKGLKVLQRDWDGCQRCGLGQERQGRSVVFGWGNKDAKFLLLYEKPSESETDDFALMSFLLSEAKIDVDDTYLTPLVGCRPTMFVPETEGSEAQLRDREPAKEELKACRPRVQELLYRVDPRLIFTFGSLAYTQLVKKADRGIYTSLDKAIGEMFVARMPGRMAPEVTYDVIPLLSMKAIMASPSSAAHGPLATTIAALHKGNIYASFLHRADKRDAEALGF